LATLPAGADHVRRRGVRRQLRGRRLPVEGAADRQPGWRRYRLRRDARINPVTYLAQRAFQPCTGNPARPHADVTWATSEEPHLLLHRDKLARDWLCAYVDQAAGEFKEYIVLMTW
jgi:hypothetical protein